GGLGPYDAASAPAPASGTTATPGGSGAKTPGFEAVLALAAVGAAVLVLRRER
ncbi:MAG: PGF-CTERM sorting domain-containing protein, partial [Halobacteriales archaeon]|nr:PGF-CTERM sorting domain-containing protein [Halobacteriales archaeon]